MGNEIDELEYRGFELLKREEWSGARQCFEEMRSQSLPPIREAKVLANIMLTFERDGLNREAADVAYQALLLLEASGLDRTMEGTSLAGRFKGQIARLRGIPRSVVMLDVGRKLVPLVLAYYFGAMIGAYFERTAASTIMGAVGGFFLLSRYFSGIVGKSIVLSTAGCVSTLAALYKLLVVEAPDSALFGLITTVPLIFLVGGFGLSVRRRR